MRIPTLLLVLAITLFAGCSDDSTTPPPPESFSVQMEVLRPDGSPVEGLTVVMWNMSDSLIDLLQDTPPKRRARTAVQFTLPQPSNCTLTSYDLDGKVVETAIDNNALPAGVHQIILNGNVDFNAGVKVMRYELVVQDPESGAELFRDDKYMTAVHLDPQRLMNGTTDADGRFTTTDRTVVPGLYDLGEQPALDENGDITGHFTLDHLLTVRLYNESGSYLRVQQVMTDGSNTIKATWDLGALKHDPRWSEPAPEMAAPVCEMVTSDVPIPVVEFGLWQNFPNPFN